MKKLFLGLFVCITTLFGCNRVVEEPLGGPVYSTHFISSFCDAKEFFMAQYHNDGNVFQIHASSEDGFRGDKYETLCQQFGDMTYNRLVPQDPTYTACHANLFTSIDIISSADFGDIKAGESLSDIVMFRGASAKTYIDNGYLFPNADEYLQAQQELEEELGNYKYFPISTADLRNGFYPCVKRLSELTPEDLTLLSCRFMSIRFMEVPEIKEHTLTLIFRTEDKEVRSQCDVVFP